jgi:arginine-tRNA-protein transferase
MARVLEAFVEAERKCVYLPVETARQDVRVMIDVSPEEYEALLVRGYRRFGPVYFRPACASCSECVSLRIPTGGFVPTKSQKRAAKACAGLRIEVARPRVDEERLALFRRWHASREEARGWDPSPTDRQSYFQSFAYPHPCAREVGFYDDDDGGKLVGVGIADETPNAWSAVYFFYEPAYAKRSLGVANVFLQLEIARSRGIPHVYLGYRVEGCASLTYKSAYRPHELLVGRPDLHDEPLWLPG